MGRCFLSLEDKAVIVQRSSRDNTLYNHSYSIVGLETLYSLSPMYNDEDWKDDLREKKRLSDEEIHKNKRSWKKLSFVALLIIAVIGVFKG